MSQPFGRDANADGLPDFERAAIDPTLRDVLARAYGRVYFNATSVEIGQFAYTLKDLFEDTPALAAAERVLAAADQWDQTDSIRDRKRLSEAVGDFRAYRSAVDASRPVEP